MNTPRIDDDEQVCRRIPTGKGWFEEPDRISSQNFQLRPGESGVSVYRSNVVSPADLLGMPSPISDSIAAEARVGDIRNLTDAAGNRLELDVEADDAGGTNPGHAEIRSPDGNMTKAMSRALARTFRPVR